MEIKLTIFFATVAITFFILYLINPKPEIIIRYPKVTEELSRLYVDDKNVCYRYKTKEITCQTS